MRTRARTQRLRNKERGSWPIQPLPHNTHVSSRAPPQAWAVCSATLGLAPPWRTAPLAAKRSWGAGRGVEAAPPRSTRRPSATPPLAGRAGPTPGSWQHGERRRWPRGAAGAFGGRPRCPPWARPIYLLLDRQRPGVSPLRPPCRRGPGGSHWLPRRTSHALPRCAGPASAASSPPRASPRAGPAARSHTRCRKRGPHAARVAGSAWVHRYDIGSAWVL
jgi:hypothetical protein